MRIFMGCKELRDACRVGGRGVVELKKCPLVECRDFLLDPRYELGEPHDRRNGDERCEDQENRPISHVERLEEFGSRISSR